MKTTYFTLTDEEGKTAGIVKASTDRELESMIMDCAISHYCVDDASLQKSLQLEYFRNQIKPQTVTVECTIDGEPPVFYDLQLEEAVIFETKVTEPARLTINRLELASTLAERDAQKQWEDQGRAENFYIDEDNGDQRMNADAQDIFDEQYAYYSELIEQCATH